jgi:2-phosphosulfolactate phosphatase
MEDMVGAGAILAALHPTTPSPEAVAAIAAYAAAAALHPFIAAYSSGRELIDLGYAGDVEAAAQLHASETVPVLRDGAFRSSPPTPLCAG